MARPEEAYSVPIGSPVVDVLELAPQFIRFRHLHKLELKIKGRIRSEIMLESGQNLRSWLQSVRDNCTCTHDSQHRRLHRPLCIRHRARLTSLLDGLREDLIHPDVSAGDDIKKAEKMLSWCVRLFPDFG